MAPYNASVSRGSNQKSKLRTGTRVNVVLQYVIQIQKCKPYLLNKLKKMFHHLHLLFGEQFTQFIYLFIELLYYKRPLGWVPLNGGEEWMLW